MASWLIVVGIAVTTGIASLLYLILDPVYMALLDKALEYSNNATATNSIQIQQQIWTYLPLVLILGIFVSGLALVMWEAKRGGRV